MDKRALIAQIEAHLRMIAHEAHRASGEAAAEARDGATAQEKRTDARVSIEFAGLARGQSQRAERAFGELNALSSFHPEPLPKGARADVGAIVEVEDEESGEGRTFFLAPAGAGVTLTGPDGDGLLSVVTPVSPIGRAVRGRKVGDVVDVTVEGVVREWAITWIG
jgi:transcription elongation GreA/GreB family factor